jgi:hypothetical protein
MSIWFAIVPVRQLSYRYDSIHDIQMDHYWAGIGHSWPNLAVGVRLKIESVTIYNFQPIKQSSFGFPSDLSILTPFRHADLPYIGHVFSNWVLCVFSKDSPFQLILGSAFESQWCFWFLQSLRSCFGGPYWLSYSTDRAQSCLQLGW